MRIAVVSQTDNPWTGPYARAFLAAGHAVQIFSFHLGELAGVQVTPLSPKRPWWVPREIWFLGVLPRLWRGLREFAPDVVFSPYVTSNGVTTALVWNGAYVVSARGSDVNRGADGRLPTWPWLHRRLIRLACSRAAGIHAVSEELAERMAESGVERQRISCFPLGVDVGALRPSAPRAEGPPTIVCTRRQEEIYRNDVIVEALSRLSGEGIAFRCVMVGGGPLLAERKEQARRLGLSGVEFAGQIPPERIGRILQESDIYISASLSDGTSSSLLEAMACGIFPVVSRIRGNFDWIRDGATGFFFDPGDVEGLALALRRAVEDGSLRESAARINRELVERCGSRDANMARMLELLKSAAGRE
jgi:glycosyltransferase involved in cell wall biosynthesis